jgi:uncharacterized protein YraI
MKKCLWLIACLILTVQTLAQNQIKIASTNINFRSNPWISDNVICVIPKATMLSLDNTNQENISWLKIIYNNKIGYVYSQYLIDPQFKSAFVNNNELNNSRYSIKHYTNSKGERVQSPTYYNKPPAGASAECRDGTYSFSRNRRGTCSHHGGVKRWL